QGARPEWVLPPACILLLTASVALSKASFIGHDAGQLTVLTALALLVALDCQGRGSPLWAGFWLAIATVKVGTMLPFLILFNRREDRSSWLALVVVVLGLCLITGAPSELPGRIRALLDNIVRLSSPGHDNDYAYSNRWSIDMIGLDHAAYR